MESDNLANWVMLGGSRTNSPQQLAHAVAPTSDNTSKEVKSINNTAQPLVYTLQCQQDRMLHSIVQEKLKQVGVMTKCYTK